MMQTVYCISGLGADEGVFQYLDLSFVHPVFLKWIDPKKDETLHDYALRLKKQFIHEDDPIILGLSLGGMIATEIAKAFPSAKIVIISSAKTKNEIPFYLKIFRQIPLYKILPDWSIRQHSLMREFFLGSKQEKTIRYVKHVAKNANPDFYKWAIGAILNWQNEIVPKNVVHLHGTNDKLLPCRFVRPDSKVEKGGHLMIIENAAEISSSLKKLLI